MGNPVNPRINDFINQQLITQSTKQLINGTINESINSSTNQSLKDIPKIASTVQELHGIWGPGFQIPLKMHRII